MPVNLFSLIVYPVPLFDCPPEMSKASYVPEKQSAFNLKPEFKIDQNVFF